MEGYKGDYAIQSFDCSIVQLLKNKYPYVVRGLLIKEINNLSFKLKSCPNFVACSKDIIREKSIQVIRKEYITLVWMLKTEQEINKFKDYEDNYICDFLKKYKNRWFSPIFHILKHNKTLIL